MATKTISIMDDVYELLVRNKKPRESFSDELRRILPKKRSIMEFAGAWSHLSEEEINDIKKSIEELRKNATKSLLKRTENIDFSR